MIKFRKYKTKSGTLILAGKNAENNEQLIKQVGQNEKVFHTATPGSPFVNIKGKPSKSDVKEAAIFCAKYSQAWRDNKCDVIVHQFNGKDIYKLPRMKMGTFGVKKFKEINIKKEEITKWIQQHTFS